MARLKLLAGGRDHALAAESVALLVAEQNELTETGKALNQRLNHELAEALQAEAFVIRARNVLFYFRRGAAGPSRVLLTAASHQSAPIQRMRDAAYSAVVAARRHKLTDLLLAFDPQDEDQIQAIGEGALLASYNYTRFKTARNNNPQLKTVQILAPWAASRTTIHRASTLADASLFTRDLVNEPPNQMTPQRLSAIAEETANALDLHLKIFGQKELQKMGAHAFLSVGKGSVHSPQMIHLTYRPLNAKAHIAIVGKGITFDSGGLSLKTPQGMEHMKTDMAGAAVALACVRAAAELKLPVQVTALLMATENMPNKAANRPGDVVRSMNGKTIEITNTDAEGRLALADGLQYAQQLKPDYLIDIATLTGAQVISLGRLMAGVMGNNSEFIQQMVEAGKKSGELLWPLPLHEPYRELIKSDTADIRNASGIPEAPTIQAGLFLSEFVSHPRWIHLDIAGPSWQEREWDVYGKSASGFGARCILTFVMDRMAQ